MSAFQQEKKQHVQQAEGVVVIDDGFDAGSVHGSASASTPLPPSAGNLPQVNVREQQQHMPHMMQGQTQYSVGCSSRTSSRFLAYL